MLKISIWTCSILLALAIVISAAVYIYRDDICKLAINQINNQLNAKVSVSAVELSFWKTFPDLSIDFREVYVKDQYPSGEGSDTLLYADLIRCRFNPSDIWRENYQLKRLDIDEGLLYLKYNRKGEHNFHLLKSDSIASESKQFKLNLEEIHVSNFRFRLKNQATRQFYSSTIHEMEVSGSLSDTLFTADAKAIININFVKSQSINLIQNKHAEFQLGIEVNTKQSKVNIPASRINIAGLPFILALDVTQDAYQLNLKSDRISIADAVNHLTFNETDELKHLAGKGDLTFDLSVKGDGNPETSDQIHCNFGVSKGFIKDPESGLILDDIHVKGLYSNELGLAKEFLQLETIAFRTSAGAFRGKLIISQFSNPLYEGYANGTLNLSMLQAILHHPAIETLSGTVDVQSNFAIQSIPTEGEKAYEIKKCDGELSLHAVNLQLRGDRRFFKNATGKAYLRGDEAGLEKVSLQIGRSDFLLNGVLESFSAYLSGSGKLNARAELLCKNLYLSDVSADSKEEKTQGERAFVLPNDINGSLELSIGSLHYEGHRFEALKGSMALGEREIRFPSISLINGGALIYGNLKIEERLPEIFTLSSHVKCDEINFKKLFQEWNNFNQEVILAENISGKAKASVQFEAPFDYRSGIKSHAIRARIDLEINEGRLRDVKALQAITESLKTSVAARSIIGKENLKAFDEKLKDLRFDQLVNTIQIENSILSFPRMEIKSSALDIISSGTHHFDNRIDYRLGFRFRDIKERQESEFGVEMDDGTGKYVFIRMHGTVNKPIVEWDSESSKAHRKENMQEEKEDVKSILKTEFGLFKNDSTVKVIQREKQEHEILKLEVDPIVTPESEGIKKKKEKTGNKLIDKWKQESGDSKKEEFVIEE